MAGVWFWVSFGEMVLEKSGYSISSKPLYGHKPRKKLARELVASYWGS